MSLWLSADARYRLGVASRVLAAVFGGYALTSALASLIALLLPIQRAQAVMTASDMGFLLYVPILLWVFHTRSAARAWGWLTLWTSLISAVSARRRRSPSRTRLGSRVRAS